MSKKEQYYDQLLSTLYGLKDDFDANLVPDEAKELLSEIIAICSSDFRVRFGNRDRNFK